MASSNPNATHVEVIFDERTIRGVVRDSDQRETPFRGWLGLIAAVEASRRVDQDGTSAPSGDRRNPSAPD